MKKATSIIIIVLSVLILFAGLILALAGVKAGWVFVVLGVLFLIYGIRGPKKRKTAPTEAAPVQPDNSLFLAVAGVTFKNDDGSSRQGILKHIAESSDYSDQTAYLERYEFEGEDAISVSTAEGIVGNIRRTDVKKVLPILEGGYIARIYPESFEDENDQLVYRADVRITPLS